MKILVSTLKCQVSWDDTKWWSCWLFVWSSTCLKIGKWHKYGCDTKHHTWWNTFAIFFEGNPCDCSSALETPTLNAIFHHQQNYILQRLQILANKYTYVYAQHMYFSTSCWTSTAINTHIVVTWTKKKSWQFCQSCTPQSRCHSSLNIILAGNIHWHVHDLSWITLYPKNFNMRLNNTMQRTR